MLLFLATALSSTANSGDSESVLADLEKALRHARSLPSDAKPISQCPDKLSELVGLSKKAVLDALGNPDLQRMLSLATPILSPCCTTTFTLGARQ
jgi:hypothetical protein